MKKVKLFSLQSTVKQGDTVEVSQFKRPKKKRVVGPVKSFDTALDESNYDSYNPSISKRS